MSTALSIVTVANYLTREAESDIKHEYAFGELFAMAGASLPHNLIFMNLAAELRNGLRDRPCRGVPNDQRVRTPRGNYYYPDAMIFCGSPQLTEERPPSLLNPVVIFEILSPTTEARDRGAKFIDYQSISTLREYVLISQDWQFVQHFTRQPGGAWLLRDYSDPVAVMALSSADIEFPISELYLGVEIPIYPRLQEKVAPNTEA